MKDLHTHLLPNIDDGATTIEESVKLIKHLHSIGVTELVLTPHYVSDSSLNCNNNNKYLIFKQLLSQLLKDNINIKLYLGNEIFISDNILDLISRNEISTINDTRYLLVELPLYEQEVKYLNIFDELITRGYKIILAHPERYPFVIKNYKNIKCYMDKGILLQGNISSLYNRYGKKSSKTLKKLISKGWISFLSSDIHHNKLPYNEKDLIKKLNWYTSKKNIRKMLITNFDKVINDLEI